MQSLGLHASTDPIRESPREHIHRCIILHLECSRTATRTEATVRLITEQWSGPVSVIAVAVIVMLVLWAVGARLSRRIRRVDGWHDEMRCEDPQAAAPGRGTERIAQRAGTGRAVPNNASKHGVAQRDLRGHGCRADPAVDRRSASSDHRRTRVREQKAGGSSAPSDRSGRLSVHCVRSPLTLPFARFRRLPSGRGWPPRWPTAADCRGPCRS